MIVFLTENNSVKRLCQSILKFKFQIKLDAFITNVFG